MSDSIPHRRVTDWHDPHICSHCGKSIDGYSPYHLVEDEDGHDVFVCDDCFEDYYGICYECEECFALDDGEYDDRKFVCSDCMEEEKYERCEHCERLFPRRDMRQTEDSGHWFCRSCLSDECWQCDDCHCWFEYTDDQHWDDYYTLCDSCFTDGWYRCCECECLCRNDEMCERNGNYYCENCDPGEEDEDDSRIHEYSFKPDGIFHKADADRRVQRKLFFGTENEFSHEYWDDYHHNLDMFYDHFGDEGDFYLKSDSSLERGFEMVSHPRTLASWHEIRSRLEAFFNAVENNIEGRDGLHVHISRKGMTPSHMTRFGVFIAAEQDHVEIIARRNSEEWARYPQKPKTGADCAALCGHNVTRYAAVNWQNPSTVELRVFRATTAITEFYAALEFSHAAYQFTKNVITLQQILKGVAWPMFMDFIHDYPDRYPALIDFLAAHATYNEEVA